MRIPLSWLQDYVTVNLSPTELAERFTMAGLEVVAIDHVGENWPKDKIFVGQIVSSRQHPHADRLLLVTVGYGQERPMEVVTGASNLRVGDSGQKVVLAIRGARLIDPYADTLKYVTLKRSKIRGVYSEGMACSEKELGISDEHSGILILPNDAPVGTPFVEYWGDLVFDLDLTPNLARCFCLTGVAREAAALAGVECNLPEPTVIAEGEPIEGQIEVEIEDQDLCSRYSAALITGVKVAPSPYWMQRRLILAGMHPINNIVDITNYVMLEWGQPLHAFDYRLLRPRTCGSVPAIIVRRARDGETMTTLDGVEHHLTSDMLLITDGGGPVAVAGIMGGLESEVSEDTEDILLEAANFHNISVRRTSAALKIPSEAAQRFGRGVDPELTLVGLRRAAELMRQLAGGTVAQGFVDAYPVVPEVRVIDLTASEIKRQLGIDLTAGEIAHMLTTLGFECAIVDGEAPAVRTTVPSFRLDVTISADLVEEVARMYGYDHLPTTLMADELPTQHRNPDLEMEEWVRDLLVGCGLTETISYSMTNLESVAKLTPEREAPDPEEYLRLANPPSREHEYLRRTLMNTTLETVARNLRFLDRVAIYEIAHVYLPQSEVPLPGEPRHLSIALAGLRAPRSWTYRGGPHFDFYDLKGMVETLCAHMGIDGISFVPTQHPTFYPGRAANLRLAGKEIGVLGQVHPVVCSSFELPDGPVYLLELDLEKLLAGANPAKRFHPISRMPPLREDLALIVDEAIAPDEMEAAMRRAGQPLLTDVVLFDVYRGEQIGPGKKSLAYTLTFQSPNKTLTSKQAAKQRDRIIKRLGREFGAQLRG